MNHQITSSTYDLPFLRNQVVQKRNQESRFVTHHQHLDFWGIELMMEVNLDVNVLTERV